LKAEANANAQDYSGWTPLHVAALLGVREIGQLLLQKFAKVDVVTRDGSTPLHIAFKNRHVKFARLLIEEKAHLNVSDWIDRTPLHWACAVATDYKIILQLLSGGASATEKDMFERTPLHLLCHNADILCSKLLERSDREATDKTGHTPLMMSAMNGRTKLLQALLDKGVNKEAFNDDKQTALHLATLNEQADVVKTLLEARVNINAVDSNSLTPLNLAVKNGQTSLVNVLLEGKPSNDVAREDPLALYRAHKKNLQLATEYGHDSILKLLMKTKIEINRTNVDGNTALHLAVQNGQEDIVQMLLDDKADANKTNKKGFTSLHLATLVAGFSDTSMCSILLKHGADVNRKTSNDRNTVLHIAVRSLSTRFLKLFLDNKAQIDIQNNEGTTALGIAVEHGYGDEIRLLLERKANPNLLDKSGKTVLEIACGSHNHSTAKILAKILIQGGASVEPMKEYTGVLLADAAAEEDKGLAKLIVEAREVQPQLDHLYGMALRAAIRSGHFESIKWLLEAGGSPYWQDEYGWSAFDLASSLRREDIVSQLQKYSPPSALSLHATKCATRQESGMRWRKRQIGETNDMVISDLEVAYSGKLEEESLTLALRLKLCRQWISRTG
jgi:ankyrin repeat protein